MEIIWRSLAVSRTHQTSPKPFLWEGSLSYEGLEWNASETIKVAEAAESLFHDGIKHLQSNLKPSRA